eukprot:10127-Heterococcus_DN1.PRE.2
MLRSLVKEKSLLHYSSHNSFGRVVIITMGSPNPIVARLTTHSEGCADMLRKPLLMMLLHASVLCAHYSVLAAAGVA